MTRRRKVLFALVPAVALSLGGETALRVFDWPPQVPVSVELPVRWPDHTFVWYRDRDLGGWFRIEEKGVGGAMVRTNPLLVSRGVHPLVFPRHVEGEVRLFALGGSTTYGEPFVNREWGFPQRLEGELSKRHPERAWRVLNAAASGMDSRGFPDLVAEILALEPDGLLIYAGHNEIRGGLLAACTEPYRQQAQTLLNSLAIFRAAHRLVSGEEALPDIPRLLQHQDDCMRSAVTAQTAWQRLRGRAGPAADPPVDKSRPWLPRWPARNDDLYLDALQTWHDNLRTVLVESLEHDVPVWLGLPAVNLLYPPSLSVFDPRLPERRTRELEADLARADRLFVAEDVEGASKLVAGVLAEDETYAWAHYQQGLLDRAAGRFDDAQRHLQAAIDLDFNSPRVTSHMRAISHDLCEEYEQVTCVDVDAAFKKAASDGLPDDALFVDFCHPTFGPGVQIITDKFADALDPAQAPGQW